mgnify:FL=1
MKSNIASANGRAAYQGNIVFTKHIAANADSWQTGMNNNILVLGCSGSGKTRNHLKPNLMQCQGSYIVLDTKGSLYDEMGAYLALQGYKVDQLDFTTMGGTCGYDPLHQVRIENGKPNQQDIIAIASAICPKEAQQSDPFWGLAAANYLSSYIAYVFEALPEREWSMASVIKLFESSTGKIQHLFNDLAMHNPDSYAASLFNRSKATCGAEKMHSSILGIIAANLLPFGFKGALDSYANPNRIDFSSFGREKRALFVTVDDIDHSLEGLTSLFIEQAFTRLCSSADRDYTEHRLPIPVRFILDDFANLNIPHIDDMLAVIRSREISATIICQTVSQLEARYGAAAANSIIGNCDRQLLLAVQDEATARYFSLRANKPAFALLETPANTWWYFERGKRGKQDGAYQLDQHPEYPFYQAICECKNQLTKDGQFAIPLEDEIPWNEESSFELASEENTTNAA